MAINAIAFTKEITDRIAEAAKNERLTTEIVDINVGGTFSERLCIGEALCVFRKPNRQSTREWAEENRFLTAEVTSRPGKMNCLETPWMLFVMECLDNPEIRVVVGKKSAQIAWTETINNWIGRTIDLDPRNIMIAFPRAASIKKFYKEKLLPYIKNTPALFSKIDGNINRMSYKHLAYKNGFLVLANAGSAEDAKSSVIPYVIVEEPDGIKKDVQNQGDGMEILKQRMKTFYDSKLVYAGTPTDKDFSQVDIAYEASNKMIYLVPCHLCNEFHELSFDNLKCDLNQDRRIDEIYGEYNPETAYYECPHCKGLWSDEEKKANVLEAIKYNNKGWYITKPESDVYGFAFNELLSSFKSSSLVNLARQKYRALTAYNNGIEGLMKSFTNNSKGEAYVPLNAGISVDELKAKRLNYPETVVPYEGLILTAGIDVQRNRFAIVVRAWGRNGNSWAVHWTEIWGDVLDYSSSVWEQLTDYIVRQEFKHAAGGGKTLKIAAATIDSADGVTSELVYRWVLEANAINPYIFAGKGTGETRFSTIEIYNEPNNMEATSDVKERKTLAQTMGVNVFYIGAYKAHEEILRRVNLEGNRDRYYHTEFSYGGYEEGLLSCRKTFETETTRPNFKLLPGKRKEVIDCEKMALHASYAIQIRNYTNVHWNALEAYLHNDGETKGN